MNAWSQEEQQEEELHESSANRLYECKPVKKQGLNVTSNMNVVPLKCFWY